MTYIGIIKSRSKWVSLKHTIDEEMCGLAPKTDMSVPRQFTRGTCRITPSSQLVSSVALTHL